MNSTPYQLHGNVAVIAFDNPPMNGFSHALRSGSSPASSRRRTIRRSARSC